MSKTLLELKDVYKSYFQGGEKLNVLCGVSLSIKENEFVTLIGPSGCGKSTLLHIAGLLDSTDSGEIIIEGKNTEKLGDKERTELRRNHIGFVYQFHHLLPEFSALENVMMPQIIAGKSRSEAKENAVSLLEPLGLAKRLEHRPAELSGGEQQRVSVARALANNPALLLADEPTGNLDPTTSSQVFDQLLALCKSRSMGILIVTHNQELAQKSSRILNFIDGKV